MILRNGIVVTPESIQPADIAVEDGRIVAIAPELPSTVTRSTRAASTFCPASSTSTFISTSPVAPIGKAPPPAAVPSPPAAEQSSSICPSTPRRAPSAPRSSTPSALALEQSSITDFALWGGIVPGNRDRLAELAERGVIGFKAFMADSGFPNFRAATTLRSTKGCAKRAPRPPRRRARGK